MSIRIMGECWAVQVSAAQKAVLMSLADQANDHGVCWPSLDGMVERTCLHRATVHRAIEQLEDLGFLRCERRPGRKTIYTIHVPKTAKEPVAECYPSHSATRSRVRPDPSHSATGPVAQCDPNPKNRQEPKDVCVARATPPVDNFPQHDGDCPQSGTTPQGSADDRGHRSGESPLPPAPPASPPAPPQPEPGAGATTTPSPASRAAIALRQRGVRVTSMHPALIAACDEGVSVEALAEMADCYPDKPAGYIIAVCRRQQAEPAQPPLPPTQHRVPNGGNRHDRQERECLADRVARKCGLDRNGRWIGRGAGRVIEGSLA